MPPTGQTARGNLWLAAGFAVLLVAAGVLGYATWAAARDSDDVSDIADLDVAAPTQAPSSTVEQAAEREVLAAYEGYREAKLAAWQARDPDHPDLARYVGSHLLDAIMERIGELGGQLELTGAPRLISAEVTYLDLAAEPPIAQVTACLDSTGFEVVDPGTGSSVPVLGDLAPGRRHAPRTDVELFPDGQWRMVKSSSQRDDPC